MGIQSPKRKALCREYFRSVKNEKSVDWDFVEKCWDQPYRELQYVAVDYLTAVCDRLTDGDIPRIKELIVRKSWWDTVDGLDRVVGHIALRYPAVGEILIEWSTDENIWLRRTAIDHQLLRRGKTDKELLEKIIVGNLGQAEFFINKAIGLSLRDYSKTDPRWVRDFIDRHKNELAPLSIKEASKYL